MSGPQADSERGDSMSRAGPPQAAKAPSGGSEPHAVGERGGNIRKASGKSARTRAREFAVQGLYQHLVGKGDVAAIDAFTRDLAGFNKADAAHFDALLHGCVAQAEAADALITPALDRPLREVSPIEHAILWIGVFEMRQCLDVPWRVVLNECVELAKDFGGTDGHKYVNGVLNALAPQLRADEVAQDRSAVRPRGTKG